MPTQTCLPSSIISQGAPWTGVLSSLWSDDGDVSYWERGYDGTALPKTSTFHMDDLPAAALTVVAPVVSHCKMRDLNANAAPGFTSPGGTFTFTNSTVYADVGASDALNGGLAWTVAGWNAATVAISSEAPNPGDAGRCSYISADVTYRLPVTGFKGLIVGVVGPLAGVLLAEMPAIAREVFFRTGRRIRILPEEFFDAWRALREPSRRYVFLGR